MPKTIWYWMLPAVGMKHRKTKKAKRVKHKKLVLHKHKKAARHYYKVVGRKKRNFQTGKSNIARDRKLKALHPGARRSKKSGRKYYEHRANRSDRNIKKRL